MKTRIALLTCLLVAVAAIGYATTAGAAPKAEPTAEIVGKVKVHKDGTATVKARYICHESEDWHLWVSAKQTEDGSIDEEITGEGSGFGHVAASWLQQHPTTFSCDGKWHTQKFQIDKSELIPEDFEDPDSPLVPVGYGELIPGYAWVQFCLINEAQGLFVIDQQWTKVR